MAMRMSVDPLMFMQNTYIVHNRPGMEAKLAIALINSSGLFVDSLDYEIEGGSDPFAASYKVRAFATRKTTGKVVYGPWIDWKLVKAEGWDKAKGGQPSKWMTMPGMMFDYRSGTFFGRLHCPERLMGMQTVDELHDTGTDGVVPAVTERGTKALLTKVRNSAARPLSEGMILADPETGQVLQEGEVAPDFAQPSGESEQDDKPEIDTSGVAAESEQQPTAPTIPSPAQDARIIPWAEFMQLAEETAKLAGLAPDKFDAAMSHWIVGSTPKGKTKFDIPEAKRNELLGIITDRRGRFS
jgi:hypothetical protein